MKITELSPVPNSKVGRVVKNNVDIEFHEDSTILFLAQFGFDIEVIKPMNVFKTKSADIFMLGTIWEIKSPITSNKATIKADFRKACVQSDNIIFDLRRVKKNADTVNNQLIELFRSRGRARRMIIVEKSGRVLDYCK